MLVKLQRKCRQPKQVAAWPDLTRLLVVHELIEIPLLVDAVIVDRDALHQAVLASASHVDEGGSDVLLNWILA